MSCLNLECLHIDCIWKVTDGVSPGQQLLMKEHVLNVLIVTL